MKVIAFQYGACGRVVSLPGDDAQVSLCDLLEGDVETTALNHRLTAVSRVDGEKLRLPIRYTMHRLGRAVEPLAGDVAVIATAPDGRVVDVKDEDLDAAMCYIRTLDHEERGTGKGPQSEQKKPPDGEVERLKRMVNGRFGDEPHVTVCVKSGPQNPGRSDQAGCR